MVSSLQIGKLAPNFLTIGVYKNQLGKIRLSDYRGKKYVVLIFYPANFTLLSVIELIRLNDHISEFKKLSAPECWKKKGRRKSKTNSLEISKQTQIQQKHKL